MKANKLIRLSDLDGWRLMAGFSICLDHNWCPPAHVNIGRGRARWREFVCLSKADVRSAIRFLPRKEFRVVEKLILVNPTRSQAFDVPELSEEWKMWRNSRALIVLDSLCLVLARQGFRMFRWSPEIPGEKLKKEVDLDRYAQEAISSACR
ncbi:MAG: hypothetical protein WCT25_04365 [Candidatus Paceibacterota bacterium]